MLDWRKLLSSKRIGDGKPEELEAQRNPFQRDYDRIVFSSAFRRLQNKTQVHPFPSSDYVRRRLTHSLEVSCVGRSLGTLVGQVLRDRAELSDLEVQRPDLAAEMGQIVSAACLAHDIGNPPFGHAGEKAIASWFSEHSTHPLVEALNAMQRSDFTKFEGNAQGFRLLTRLQNSYNTGGMKLTAATLSAFTKYPCTSEAANKTATYVGNKKHGFFAADLFAYEQVAAEVGIPTRASKAWSRHPLVFLVEAADDICYRVIDVEDGWKLGRVSFTEAEDCLVDLLTDKTVYSKSVGDPEENLGWLRARVIGDLIDAVQDAFFNLESAIMRCELSVPLLKKIEVASALERADSLVRSKIFEWDRTIEVEIAGARMLQGLLDDFMEAAATPQKFLSEKLLKMVPHFDRDAAPYEQVLAVTDFIAGMTDSYLLQTHQKTRGLALG